MLAFILDPVIFSVWSCLEPHSLASESIPTKSSSLCTCTVWPHSFLWVNCTLLDGWRLPWIWPTIEMNEIFSTHSQDEVDLVGMFSETSCVASGRASQWRSLAKGARYFSRWPAHWGRWGAHAFKVNLYQRYSCPLRQEPDFCGVFLHCVMSCVSVRFDNDLLTDLHLFF